MRVGWQEWDKISFNAAEAETPIIPTPGEDKSTDWWNSDDTANSDSPGASSLPLDTWLPFSPHDTGISEIAVKSCFMDHAFGYCYPNTTPEEVSYP